jgi:hypothetical protein
VLRHLNNIIKLKMLETPPYSPVGWSKCTGCGFHDRCWKEARAKSDVALVYGVDQGLAVTLHHQGVQKIGQLVDQFGESNLAALQRPWGIQASGSCRLVPRQAVVLVVTDEYGRETCFGFMKFPPAVRDINGKALSTSSEPGRAIQTSWRSSISMSSTREAPILNASPTLYASSRSLQTWRVSASATMSA